MGKGYAEVVELLLQIGGTNLASKHQEGRTPFSLAEENGHRDIITMLLREQGEDPNHVESDGQIALHTAVRTEPFSSLRDHRAVIK